MTLLGIQWIWWLLGTFGIGGVALLAYFAPAVALGVGQWLLKFVLTTPIGAALATAAVVWFVADTNRSIRDQHEFAARTAAYEQLQAQRDVTIRQETREDVLRESGEQALANAKTDQQVKEFKDALPPVPYANGVNPFRVGDASCRLRALAGQVGCGSERPKGVPQARPQGAGAGTGHRPRFRLPGFVTGSIGRAAKGQ